MERDANYWRTRLSIGDILNVSDSQGIEDTMDRGEGLDGTEYTIANIRHFKDSNGIADRIIFDLEGPDQDVLLVIKIVGKEISKRLYYEVEEFDSGSRADVVKSGGSWLFKEPDDLEDFEFVDLEYNEVLELDIDGDDVEFEQVQPGTFNGACTYDESLNGLGNPTFMSITEYSTDEERKNPFFMIIEEESEQSVREEDEEEEEESEQSVRDEDEEEEDDPGEGGYIDVYLGTEIEDVNIEHLPMK